MQISDSGKGSRINHTGRNGIMYKTIKIVMQKAKIKFLSNLLRIQANKW